MRVTRRLAKSWELRIDTADIECPAAVHAPDDTGSVDYDTAVGTGYVERIPIPELVLNQLDAFDEEVNKAHATARGYTL